MPRAMLPKRGNDRYLRGLMDARNAVGQLRGGSTGLESLDALDGLIDAYAEAKRARRKRRKTSPLHRKERGE